MPRSSAAHRWSQSLSGLTAGARATLDGALLAQRSRRPRLPLDDEVNLASMVLHGSSCYDDVSLLLLGGLRSVAPAWRMEAERGLDAEALLRLVVGLAVLRSQPGAGAPSTAALSPLRWQFCCSERRCGPVGPGLWLCCCSLV